MTAEPEWIDPDLVEWIHAEQLKRHGGARGVRDRGRLDAALSRPRNLFVYEGADIFRLAASYAHGIISGHPFVDGNKRTSFVVAMTFLAANGRRVVAQAEDVHETWVGLASGRMTEIQIADWLRNRCE